MVGGMPSSSPAERPEDLALDQKIASHGSDAAMRAGCGGAHLKASAVVILSLPFGVSLLAFATTGVTRSLSLQYLQTLICSLSILIAFFLLEKILPSAGPRKRPAQILLDIQDGILLFLGVTVAGALGGFGASLVERHLDLEWLDLRFRSADTLPALAATVFLSYLIFDFFNYWYHRSQHTFAILWQVHKLHHMDKQLSVTTRLRNSVSDIFIGIFFILIPTALFFRFDPIATVKLSLLMKLGGEFQSAFIHSNLRLHFGRASVVLVGPQLHRIHHSILTQHHNRNFGGWFPIWDILFGTYYHPSRAEFPPTGIEAVNDVSSIGELVAVPFRGWWEMLCGWRQRQLG